VNGGSAASVFDGLAERLLAVDFDGFGMESAAISGRIDRATSRLSETESMATKLRREHDVHG
jgi:hypothetical protein